MTDAIRVERAIASGVDFLMSRQGDDGLWRDFLTPAGEASAWPTAYVGHSMELAGLDQGALSRAAAALEACQHPDGGWGYNEGTPSDSDSTSWAVLFLSRMPGHDRACRRAVSFIVDSQHRLSGGFATYAEAGPIRRYVGMPRWVPFGGWRAPHVEVSATAGRALWASGADGSHAKVRAAWEFVRSRQNADGSWSSYWWTSPHFATQQAVDLAVTMRDIESARLAAQWALRAQRSDGSWGDGMEAEASSFATALSTLVLEASGIDDSGPIRRAVRALIALQEADGGWQSHPMLRIPVPADSRSAGEVCWRPFRFQDGIVVEDHHRMFGSATCVAALTRGLRATR
jgi:squalene-hopene/tetraprenyl-beta-curcumene cyclase